MIRILIARLCTTASIIYVYMRVYVYKLLPNLPYLPIFRLSVPLSRLGCYFVRLKAKKPLKTKIRSIGSIVAHLHQSSAVIGNDCILVISMLIQIHSIRCGSIVIVDSDSEISIHDSMIGIPIVLITMCNLMIWFCNLMIKISIVRIFGSI